MAAAWVRETWESVGKKILLVVGLVAFVVLIAYAVSSRSACAHGDPSTAPGLPTMHTNPSTYIVNGDGTHSGCVVIHGIPSCTGR